MALDHVKSAAITNLDATPPLAVTTGEGAMAYLKEISGFVTVPASGTINSTYQFCRVPSNCKVKSIIFESEAQTAGAIDIGVYYATDGTGGRPAVLLATNAINQTLFANAVSAASAVTPVEKVGSNTVYTLDKRTQPLWQAAGLTADPGGFFDIVGTATTAFTTAAAKMGMSVRYTE